jgi:hypothetical protein
MKILFMPIVVLLAMVHAGCVSDTVKFANSSTNKLDMSREKKVLGKAGGFLLFAIIPIGVNSRQQCAYDDMMMKVGSGFQVVDINVVDQWKWVIIGTKFNTYMTALAYPVKPDAPVAPVVTPTTQPLSDPTAQKLEELKRLYKAGHLTDTEYEAARRKALGL